MKDFRDLKVWERGHKLTLEIYKITSIFLPSKASLIRMIGLFSLI
jgi:hypothetical protein